jgi:hypothetical protein
MILSLKNVTLYLLECGLLRPEAIVEGDVMIIEAPRRNLNFKVIRKKGPGFFVKQIQVWNAQISAEMQREAACYWLAEHDRAFAPLAAIVPKYAHYDPARSILITELLPDGENVSDFHRRLGSFPVDLAEALGRLLATYHRLADGGVSSNQHLASFPKTVPWILSIHQQNPSLFTEISRGNTQMIGVMQQYPDFQRALDDLRSQWQRDRLIHGDMKWDNCLVEGRAGASEPLKLRLVDWELADVGDACWDVGAVFQAYLSFWILSIQLPAGVLPAQSLHLAQYPVEAMQPAIRRFWETYRDAMELNGPSANAWLNRSVKYAAARMIQTVFEYMQHAPQLTPNAFCLLQVSMNILLKPGEAICDLLALPD